MGSIFTDILGRTVGLDRPFILGRASLRFGELLAEVDRICAALGGDGRLNGARVAVCFDQGPDYLASLLGIRKAGGVVVPLAPQWTPAEQQRVIVRSEARFALADMPAVGTVAPRAVASVGRDSLLLTLSPSEETAAEPGDAVIIFTSGTTGEPKGVVLTEAGLSANVRAVASYLGLQAEDASPIFTPPCYAYSISQNLVHAWVGASILPVATGLKLPAELLRQIGELGLTGVSANPTAFRLLCAQPGGAALPSVRYVMTGGQPLSLQLVTQMERLFPRARVCNMYGCTENGPRISYFWLDGRRGRDVTDHHAVGVPVEGTELRLVDGTGQPVPAGESGEILVTGTSLMSRYWKDPAGTNDRLRAGWLHTRDMGYVDSTGLLFLTGRANTLINVGNQKVSPEEVEQVLSGAPGVVEAAVYGVADPVTGEAVAALVVVEGAFDVAALQRHCRGLLSSHKVPSRIEAVAGLPKTLYGKIDRKALAARGKSGANPSV
ncbi:class I adenylate-forming enzyme family protein [Phaeospirillum tilakii]|uniref:Class I adenylate-forming enzyme family protein n=1 Tax=Phaeospirillum tilakii TaxID=741673 RepID=A0ABW5CHN7_9PROT